MIYNSCIGLVLKLVIFFRYVFVIYIYIYIYRVSGYFLCCVIPLLHGCSMLYPVVHVLVLFAALFLIVYVV